MKQILDVTLDEATHVYSDSNNQKYDSVTTILGHYKEKFDPYKIKADGNTIIGGYVEKHGFTEEYWLNEWEKTKNNACRRGTAWHKIKEEIDNQAESIKYEMVKPTHSVRYLQKEVDRNPGIDYSKLPNGSYQELTIFNRRFMIAGQADKVVIEDGWFDIIDYKTNGEFNMVSFKPPRGSHKMMYRPLHKLMDCHLGHYTAQLSTYAWMLKQFGLKPRKLSLLHTQILPEHEERILAGIDIPDLEPTLYDVNYEEEIVIAMVKDFVNNVRRKKTV